MKTGFTLIETLAVLVLLAVAGALALPRLASRTDRRAVRQSAGEIASFYGRARMTAVFSGSHVRIEFDADSLQARRRADDSTLFTLPGPARYGVSLEASRDVIDLSPTGLGWGAANTKIVLTRGAAAESLTTSRLGRLKRWY
jgi:prepilin-type N-terminal cleavage/methylation domain-containing protein